MSTMKLSFHRYLVYTLMILGVSFTVINPAIAQINEPSEPQQGSSGAELELKPDLPKLDTRKHEPKPHESRQLKGSIQHSELMSPQLGSQMNGRAGQSKLEGNARKGQPGRELTGKLNQEKESGLGIIGLKFAMFFGRDPVIYQIFPGTPAAEAGLRSKDIIIAVDGIPTFGLSKNEVYNMIVGQPGTEVTISFKHNSDFQTRRLTRMDVNDIKDPKVRRDYLSM